MTSDPVGLANTLEPSMKRAVIVNDTRQGRHYGCEAVMQALIVLLARQGIRPIWFQRVGKAWEGDDEFLQAAASADILIVNGEGSIHHANKRARSLARVGVLAKSTLQIPAVLLNATLHANDEAVYRDIANFDVVSVRDRASVLEAESFGLKDIAYCPDLSMFHGFQGLRPPRQAAALRVGITDSVVAEVSERLAAFGAARQLIDCSIWMSRRHQTVYDYAAKVASLDLLVTGRFHSVCYALATRTPFVAVESNTPKITSLLSDILGDASRVVAPEQIESLDFKRFAVWTEAEAQALDAFLATRSGQYATLGARIRALLPAAAPTVVAAAV